MGDDLERLKAAVADRYVIEREIGAGGMATVYLARDLRHDRPVALKVLDADLTWGIGPERFLREIRTTANLSHPHILPLFDSGVAGEVLWYVMPYVAGESLRARLTRENQLPVDDALRITRDVADALSYAHAHGVVHRDVKPENILLEAGHAVIADFGIARATETAVRPGAVAGLTGTGVVVGTPAYMSPEQAAGGKELDGRSDLYSLGCVLYEMLAGHPPFTGPTSESVVYQHLAAEPPRITGIRPAVPAGVAMALERALAKTPADRFHPAALFAEALGHADSGATPTPPPGDGLDPGGGRRASSRSAWKKSGVAVVGLAVLLGMAVLLGTGMVLGWWPVAGTGAAGDGGHPRTAVAVLPFENLSGDGPYGYFAAGLHDELLSQLARAGSLSVRGRTSVMGYAGTTKPLRVIADELAVGTIVEGSVQVVGDRLRVVIQLMDAATDEHLWADSYDRTLDDAFQVQSEIARQIVRAVGTSLPGAEASRLPAAPTDNPAAYQLYLRGIEYDRRPAALRSNWEIAQGFYERALALDSTFALAWAALSVVHGQMSFYRFDPSPERVAMQRKAAEAALRFAPDLPESHRAMGVYRYFAERDWHAALAEYRIALQGMPNDAGTLSRIAATHRRLGEWDLAISGFEAVLEVDPRNVGMAGELGFTLHFTRRYREGIAWYTKALELAPDAIEHDLQRGRAWLMWQGRLDSLHAVLRRHPEEADFSEWGSGSRWRAEVRFWSREPDSLLALVRRVPHPVFASMHAYLPTAIFAGWAHQLRGGGAAGHVAFEQGLALLDSAAVTIAEDWRVHAARGLALAGLGRRAEARDEARWLQESGVYRDDALLRPRAAEARARILAGIGDAEAAVEEVERLLAEPSEVSVHTVRLDPLYDPIRADPRFRALLTRYRGGS
jgi:eukaryotic-like serine/threonine-protein kinase